MAKRKKSRGRPPIARGDAKLPVQIRMGASEKEAFSLAASLSGLSLSAWIRERLRAAALAELREMDKDVPFLR